MARYLKLWLVTTAILVFDIAVFDVVVDPYGLFRVVDRPGFNAVKPKEGPRTSVVKAYDVSRVRPLALIVGNSRAEVGLDPEQPAFPEDSRPVYNLALPGTGPVTTLEHLRHVIANASAGRVPMPKLIVWGIDFPDFLVDARTPPRSGPSPVTDRRLLTGDDAHSRFDRGLQRLRDYGESALTLGALLDAVETVSSQRDPLAANITPLGFNPLHNYVRVTAEEGVRAVFAQKDVDNASAYLRRPPSIFDASGRSGPDLEDLRLILDLCRRHAITLKLVIYPVHAHLLEIIRMTDHWPAFETWKRAVVAIVDDEARASHATPVPIWDFSGFHHYAVEAIPKAGDRKATMQWYWEAGHFKSRLGDRMLERVFGTASADPAFGVLLDASTVERQIDRIREGETAYRKSQPDEINGLEAVVLRLRRPR